MALFGPFLRRLFHRPRPALVPVPVPARRGQRSQRGATLTEYALLVSLVVVTSIGAIQRLQTQSGSYLVATGSDVGTPQPLAAQLVTSVPVTPVWLTQPPAPTTTTTAPTTTTTAPTTTTTVATTTTSASTTTTSASTTTTASSYPTGGIIYQGAMYSMRHTGDCYQVESPYNAGASTGRYTCTSANNQKIKAVGTSGQVALTWNAYSTLCLAASGTTTNVMATCGSATSQQFVVSVDGSGWVTFKPKGNTTLCVAEYSSGLELEACANTDRQKFKFS